MTFTEYHIYQDEQTDLSIVRDKTIAVIGYGKQGKAQANNLRDSGLRVIIGASKKGTFPDWKEAEADGFKVMSIEDATATSQIVHVLLPDDVQPEVYEQSIEPHLKPGSVLSFSHGFNLLYGLIKPPRNVDVIVFVPEAPGVLVREQYLKGEGVYGLVAVDQDCSGKAREIALAIAKANRCTRVGVLEITVEQEVEIDNFVEQVVKGGTAELIHSCVELLAECGCNPLHAYLKVVNGMRSLVNLVRDGGIEYAWTKHSTTCEYAARTRGPRIINRDQVRVVLDETEQGKFARDWMLENMAGAPVLNKLRRTGKRTIVEKAALQARKMYPQ